MTKMGPDVVHYWVGEPMTPQILYQYYPAGRVLAEAAEQQYRKLAAKSQ